MFGIRRLRCQVLAITRGGVCAYDKGKDVLLMS